MPWLATDGSALTTLAFTVVFSWLLLGLGRRALILLGAGDEATPFEKGVLGIGLGAGALQFVPFGLASLGLMTPSTLKLALGLMLLAALPDSLRATAAIARAIRASQPQPALVTWALALSPALLTAVLVGLTPSMDPDGLAYHLTVPKRWLQTGHLNYLPTYPYSNSPMGMEMLFSIGMVFVGDTAAKCIHLVLGIIATASIYLLGRRLDGPLLGALPATLFLVGPGGVAGVLGWSYVEGGAALAAAGAALAWLLWYQSSARAYLRVGAALAGVAVSFKIAAALVPVMFFALTVWALWKTPRLRETGAAGERGALGSAARVLPLAAAPVLPWLIRAAIVTGNPVFPLFASRIPSRDLAPDLASKMDSFNRYWVWGTSLAHWTLQQRKALLLAVAALYLVAACIAWFRLRTPMARGVVVVLTAAALVQLSAAGLYLRYYLPLLGPFLVLILAPFAAAFRARAPASAQRWVMPLVAAFALVGALSSARNMFYGAGGDLGGWVRTLAGLEPRPTFLRQRLILFPLYQYANRALPGDAGVLLAASCSSGFYLDRDTYCAEIVQSSLRYHEWGTFASDLRRLRISHVIAPISLAGNDPLPPTWSPGSVSAITRPDQYRVVRRLLREHARELSRAADHGLYEISASFLSPTGKMSRP